MYILIVYGERFFWNSSSSAGSMMGIKFTNAVRLIKSKSSILLNLSKMGTACLFFDCPKIEKKVSTMALKSYLVNFFCSICAYFGFFLFKLKQCNCSRAQQFRRRIKMEIVG